MDTKWIALSPEAETCIKVALIAEIARHEAGVAPLKDALLVPPSEQREYVEACRWLETARLTLEAIENASAVGVQVPFMRDPR